MVLEKEMEVNAGVEELKAWLKLQQHLPQTMCEYYYLLYVGV